MRDAGAVRGRVAVVLAVGVVVLVAALVGGAAVRAGATGRATAFGSSLRADESGHRAARLLLEDLGYVAESRRGARLPDGVGHVLIRVEGLPGADDSETPEREREAAGRELAEWVERGNAALVLGAQQVAGTGWPEVRDRIDFAIDPQISGPPAAVPVAPALDLLFGDRPTVPEDGGDVEETHRRAGLADPWITPYHVIRPGVGDEVLVARGPIGSDGVIGSDGAEPVVVASRRAAGRVVTIADPWFATNARLGRADNAAWLAALVGDLEGGGQIWFDDRALGQVATRGVLSLLYERGLGPALAAALLLVVFVWWRVGPSDAPLRRVLERLEYRPEAYATMRADLYATCLRGDDIRRVVAYEIARRLGRGDTATPERAVRLLAVRDPDRARAVRDAVGALPDPQIAPFVGHPRLWVRTVANVFRTLAPAAEPEPSSTESEDPKEIREDV